jgi:hypothetical protein
VVLSAFNGSIHILGASSMLVNRTNALEAIVVNAQYQQDPNAPVAWQNLDPSILDLVVNSNQNASVTSKAVGAGRIVASSGSLVDTLRITVVADTSQPAPRKP